MTYSFEAPLEQFEESLWGYHFIVPEELVEATNGTDRRMVVLANGLHRFHAALMSTGKGQYFVYANEELRKKLKIQLGDIVVLEMDKDESDYGMPVPDSFLELLQQDSEGDYYFHKLTKGKQRNLIHIINKPKNENLKIHKAVVILEYLKSVQGKLDFREMNQALKDNPFSIK